VSRLVCLVAAVGCASNDDPSATDTDEPEDTDHVHDTDTDTDDTPAQTELVEYDSQGVACISGPVVEAFGEFEEIRITVLFGCIEPCDLLSTETRCSSTLLSNTLAVQGHGHAVYALPDPSTATTECTEPCQNLNASCAYKPGLAAGDWVLSYSATVVPFTIPSANVVCAADTDDT
jgi:hypothetical protein